MLTTERSAPPRAEVRPTAPSGRERFLRLGRLAWAVVGVVVVLVILGVVVARFSLVVVPLLLALFPAALLAPAAAWLKRKGVPPAVAAIGLVVFSLVATVGLVALLGWLITNELTQLVGSLEDAYDDIRDFLVSSPLGYDPGPVNELTDRLREIGSGDDALDGARSAAVTAIEVLSAILFGLVALFFYLKDGAKISGWLASLLPSGWRQDLDAVGNRVWSTLGAYFRGQLIVALVDAVFIGLGLVLLGVPLALPLAVLVFFGGLFPIVGAVTTGALAVLVALADTGVVTAIMVLVLVLAVQQIEGNVLEPLIVGRATRLHPMAVIVALTSGAVLLGILGAFLAVPVAACAARAIGYLRGDREDGEPGTVPAPASG